MNVEPGASFTYLIDWGDRKKKQSVTPFAAFNFATTVSHTYGRARSAPFQIKVKAIGNGTGGATGAFAVTIAPPARPMRRAH